MKFEDIVSRYDIDRYAFESFIERQQIPHRKTFSGIVIEDFIVPSVVKQFEEELLQMEHEKHLEALENENKIREMSKMLITSGFNFDGYKIVKYSGYISGDDAMTVSRGSSFTDGGVRDKLMASLVEIRRNALRELKEAAYDLGCNAVIGVDFDYITLDPQTANLSGGTTYQPYVFCVTANGNAVIIEKTED